MASTADNLDERASYGKLPFDCFVLAHWDYAQPSTGDQEQWDRLAREWLALGPRERHLYRETSYRPRSNPELPTAAQVARVLAPHQTAPERRHALSAHLGRHSPVWVRTCYDPTLAETYAAHYGVVSSLWDLGIRHVFDDERLYGSFGTAWARVLLRVPSIPDAVQGQDALEEEEEEDEEEDPEEEYMRDVCEVQGKVVALVFLVDEQAVMEGTVKLLWLDVHGNCVWENRVRPDSEDVLYLRGLVLDGQFLSEIVGSASGRAELFQRGTLLVYS